MDKPHHNLTSAWINGFIGVLIFSGSMPATKFAVIGFSPLFVTLARASVAGILAILALIVFKQNLPTKKQFSQIVITSLGVVIGFPFFSALALMYITAANSLVFIGILPLLTAIFGVIRNGEKPKPSFWLFSIVGASLVVGFAIYQGFNSSPTGNILMFLAVILCGMGYAEGAKLSKNLGGLQVISWALVVALPLMLLLLFFNFPADFESVTLNSWIGLAYISVFSMFIGFIFWYKGLSQGGTTAISQLQLLQPFFGLALAATLLKEEVSTLMMMITVGVILCVIGSKKFGS